MCVVFCGLMALQEWALALELLPEMRRNTITPDIISFNAARSSVFCNHRLGRDLLGSRAVWLNV